jgi:plasmid maintenance system antidote protein VapI
MPRAKAAAGGAAGKTPAAELNRQIAKFGITKNAVTKTLGINPQSLNALLEGKKKIDIELALLFGKFFETGETYWIEIQRKAGLAEAKSKLAKKLASIPKASTLDIKKGPKPGVKKGPKAGAKKGPKAGAKKGPKAGAKRGPKAGAKRGPKAKKSIL